MSLGYCDLDPLNSSVDLIWLPVHHKCELAQFSEWCGARFYACFQAKVLNIQCGMIVSAHWSWGLAFLLVWISHVSLNCILIIQIVIQHKARQKWFWETLRICYKNLKHILPLSKRPCMFPQEWPGFFCHDILWQMLWALQMIPWLFTLFRSSGLVS